MRNHFKYIVAILLLLFVSVSCTSNFEDVSKNPNASDEALPQALLAPALTSVVKANMSRTRSLTNELMQVTVLMGGETYLVSGARRFQSLSTSYAPRRPTKEEAHNICPFLLAPSLQGNGRQKYV